jgi:hypothetical protein
MLEAPSTKSVMIQQVSGRVAPQSVDGPRNCRLCVHIVDGRYFAGITTIDKIDELVDESRCDIAKDILDRHILDLDMPDSDRVLKNADTPGA